MEEHPTYAAERCTDVETLFTYALLAESPITREGAVYGLEKQALRIIGLLQRMRSKDKSPGVRESASDALLDIQGAFEEDHSPDGAIIDGMER